MKESTFKKLEILFWLTFIFIPFFTGWFIYQSHPNEYDANKHELLESHSIACGTEGMLSCEMPDKWIDKSTGETYTSKQFAEHRQSEAKRISATVFAYGLFGCLFFAYSRVVLKREPFISGLRKAVAANFLVSLFFYWMT